MKKKLASARQKGRIPSTVLPVISVKGERRAFVNPEAEELGEEPVSTFRQLDLCQVNCLD